MTLEYRQWRVVTPCNKGKRTPYSSKLSAWQNFPSSDREVDCKLGIAFSFLGAGQENKEPISDRLWWIKFGSTYWIEELVEERVLEICLGDHWVFHQILKCRFTDQDSRKPVQE